MKPAKLILAMFIVAFLGCNKPKTGQNEAKIHELSLKIMAYRNQLNSREVYIASTSKLSAAEKAKRNYDSLVNVQQKQTEEYVVLMDSLELLKAKSKTSNN